LQKNIGYYFLQTMKQAETTKYSVGFNESSSITSVLSRPIVFKISIWTAAHVQQTSFIVRVRYV